MFSRVNAPAAAASSTLFPAPTDAWRQVDSGALSCGPLTAASIVQRLRLTHSLDCSIAQAPAIHLRCRAWNNHVGWFRNAAPHPYCGLGTTSIGSCVYAN